MSLPAVILPEHMNTRTRTPPPTPAPNTLDTPVQQRAALYAPYSSINGMYQQPAYVYAAAELQNKYIFTTPDAFLAKHLPESGAGPTPEINQNALVKLAASSVEKLMYAPLIKALQPAVKVGWNLVSTSEHLDPDSKFILDTAVKPDITLYGPDPPSNSNVCRSCDTECFLELKTDPQDDPFADTDLVVVEKSTPNARDTRGQIISYLNAMQASQLRTHSFGAVLIKNKCRLLRLTRSGLEVTRLFDYTTSSILATFLWRLSNATAERRGVDTTLERVPPTLALDARKLLDAVERPMWKVSIAGRSFYISTPFTRSHYLPVGRGTRCFIALESETKQKCLLKDTWRVVGYHPEGEAYAKKLQECGVQNIPKVLAAGDVTNSYHVCGDYNDYPLSWTAAKPEVIRQHQHYRIVLDIVGKPLVEFTSSHELVQCILNAIEAHEDAWTKAHVEHRDISVGNIIIASNSDGTTTGLLIDWELSRFQEDGPARANERTGTRQFMSVRLCVPSPPARTLGDELESFLLVLLWVAAAYVPSNMSPVERSAALKVFDDPDQLPKRRMFTCGEESAKQFFLTSLDFELLLSTLLNKFRYRYLIRSRRANADEDEKWKGELAALETHECVGGAIRTALQKVEWKTLKDPAEAQTVAVTEDRSKRKKSQLTEYGDSVYKRGRRTEPDEDVDLFL
ncbi:hypothetical protein C8R44DRAFT_986054 [Mycena epipterygia]|nr:hypothetical protein C8R44DRAFT_986054 [Mycena epipterygia]